MGLTAGFSPGFRVPPPGLLRQAPLPRSLRHHHLLEVGGARGLTGKLTRIYSAGPWPGLLRFSQFSNFWHFRLNKHHPYESASAESLSRGPQNYPPEASFPHFGPIIRAVSSVSTSTLFRLRPLRVSCMTSHGAAISFSQEALHHPSSTLGQARYSKATALLLSTLP